MLYLYTHSLLEVKLVASPDSFDQLNLPEPLLKAIESMGFKIPTPIQSQAIPHLLDGKDLLGQAQTGTGKTAAFALPLMARLDLDSRATQILVLAPTRELAIQVAEAFNVFAKYLKNFEAAAIYGGQSYTVQMRALKRGVQVIVGTPGRMLDHLNRGTIDLSQLKALVLDEADEMLRMGFIADVETIMAAAPKQCQMAMFSATMPPAVRKITRRYLKSPQEIKIASKTTTVEQVEQSYVVVSRQHKLDVLVRILETGDHDGCLIFTRTRLDTSDLAEKLEVRGYSAAALNGDMNQINRERTIKALKSEKLDIVVATDVAARGLDVGRISLVVNFDIPFDTEAYTHRIGRTGRAGREGKAILFVSPSERRMMRSIERATGQPIKELELPTADLITQRRAERFKKKVVDVCADQDLSFYKEFAQELDQSLDLKEGQLLSALLYLAQKDNPLKAKISDLTKIKFPASKGFKETQRGPRLSRDQLATYRIEVGKNHGVRPVDIVGAIANEGNIDSQSIGHIDLFDIYSVVELPKELGAELIQDLAGISIKRRKLNISLMKGYSSSRSPKDARGRSKPSGGRGFRDDGFRGGKSNGRGGGFKPNKGKGKRPANVGRR